MIVRWMVLCIGTILIGYAYGCGGGHGGDVPTNLAQGVDFSDQSARVSVKKGFVTIAASDEGKTKAFVLNLPIQNFGKDTTLPLGADNLFGQNQNEAFVLVFDGIRAEKASVTFDTVYVSLGGSIHLTAGGLHYDDTIAGSFHITRMAPIDSSTQLIPRGGNYAYNLQKNFSATVRLGGTNSNIIYSVVPTSGPIGTTVTIKGQNLGNVRSVRFSQNCFGKTRSPFPFERVSERELRITIDQMPCDPEDTLALYESSHSATTEEAFRIEVPFIRAYDISLRSPPVYDSTQDRVFFVSSRHSSRLWGYSFSQKKISPNAYLGTPVASMDTTGNGEELVVFDRAYDRNPDVIQLNNFGILPLLESQTLNRSDEQIDLRNNVVLGKGRKGFIENSSELKWINLNTGFVGNLPEELHASFRGYSDALLRSSNRDFIVLQRKPDRGSHPTVIYRALEDGDFEKTATADIHDTILGIHESAEAFWSPTTIYNVHLERIGNYNVPDWNTDSALGIIFDPQNLYAILFTKTGHMHILDATTRAVLASNIPIQNCQNFSLAQKPILSGDGSELFLSTSKQVLIVDFSGLLQSIGLSAE